MSEQKVYPYYNFNRIESYPATIKGIIGGRGIGKTYGLSKRKIKEALKDVHNGAQFIYMRRYKDDLPIAKSTFFAAVGNEFPDWDFRDNGWLAECAPAETRDSKKREWFTIGYFIALSMAQKVKSSAFPRVKSIIFDEVILEKGFTRYIPGEVTALLGFMDTVDRKQDRVTVYLLSNAVSIDNPYFLEWDIKPDETRNEQFVTRRNGFITIHFPDTEQFSKAVYQSKFGQFIQDTAYGEYSVGNKFSDNNTNLILQKDPKARYRFSLETKKGSFSVWKNPLSGVYYLQEKQPKDVDLYTIVPEWMSEEKKLMPMNSKTLQSLRTAFRSANMFFDTPSTRNAFIEISNR